MAKGVSKPKAKPSKASKPTRKTGLPAVIRDQDLDGKLPAARDSKTEALQAYISSMKQYPLLSPEKELAVARDLVWVVLLQEVIKVLNQDQVIQRRLVLKVDRCLFNVVFRSLVLRILTV